MNITAPKRNADFIGMPSPSPGDKSCQSARYRIFRAEGKPSLANAS
jgi:hypothetical protein